MLNKKDCKMMCVKSSSNTSYNHKRVVITINKDGSCLAVMGGCEDAFFSEKRFAASQWDHCKPIPEKKTRPMTNDEMRGFIVNTPGIEYKHKSWNYWITSINLSTRSNPEDWLYRTISPTGETGEPQKFELPVEVEE